MSLLGTILWYLTGLGATVATVLALYYLFEYVLYKDVEEK